MTRCILSLHLERNKRLAQARREDVEIRRLASELTEHRGRCVVCADIDSAPLVQKFFNHPVIVITEERS
jgi:hypothetical protein